MAEEKSKHGFGTKNRLTPLFTTEGFRVGVIPEVKSKPNQLFLPHVGAR